MEISIVAEPLIHLGGFVITNSLLWAFLVSGFGMLAVFLLFRPKRFQEVPSGFQNGAEAVFEGLLSFMENIVGDKELAKRFFPLVATIFLFVLFSNWSGLLPGAGTVTIPGVHNGHEMLLPLLRSPSADLNMTAAVAIVAMCAVQFFGVSALGLRGYGSKFFIAPWKKPYVIGTAVGFLELIGEFAKILSFSFRLFGNVFAGEVLLLVMLNLMPYIVPLPFLMLEVFVGIVQAGVFSLLTLVFLKMATEAHEHEGAH
jgi:F-type H+-transporting ATPase subunit a